MPKDLPYFHCYPTDYLTQDIAFLSLAAQGLWMRLEHLMHTSERYGYLTASGNKPMPALMIARRLSQPVEAVEQALEELEQAGWLQREQYTKILFSQNLLDQAEARARNRGYKVKHDQSKRGQTSLNLSQTFDEPPPNLSQTSSEPLADPPGKSLKLLESSKTDVRRHTRYDSDSLSISDSGSSRNLLESPLRVREADPPGWETGSPPVVPLSAEELASRQVAAFQAKVSSPGLHEVVTGKPPRPKPETVPLDELLADVALASPAGVAQGWSEALVLGAGDRLLGPVLRAVDVEVKDQGLSRHEAAVWLKGRVSELTAVVSREQGWERFWTATRMARAYAEGEYRGNLARFDRTGGQSGNGNGSGGGHGAAAGGGVSGARKHTRSAFAAALERGREPVAGAAGGDDRASRHVAAGGADESGRVPSGDAGLDRGPVRSGAGGSNPHGEVLPEPRRATVLGWPA